MADAIKCDRCKQYKDGSGDTVMTNPREMWSGTGIISGNYEWKICNECIKKLIKFMKATK